MTELITDLQALGFLQGAVWMHATDAIALERPEGS